VSWCPESLPVVALVESAPRSTMNCRCILSPVKRVLGLPSQLRPRFLSGLSEAELNYVLSAASHRQFRAASVVINQEDSADRFFMLTSGHGRHFVITDDGRKIILHWLTAGRIFGGAAIVSTPMRYLLSTELVSDSCALVWERQAIRNLASRCPKLLDNALSLASTELIPWLTAAHISLSSDDAQGRVAHLLESLASAIGRATPSGVEMSITNEDLAEGANVTPFTVSRCLSDWQSAGIVVKRRGKLLLRKPELLLGVSQ
jgi:CRP-like cAMP-binding protein